MNLYWGDLHSHCSISYGHGSVEQALLRAKAQLDFCSITGHAFWPDMPTDRERYAEIIDYHNAGFARLASNWHELLARQAAASQPGEFIAFPSYEWHSLKYGDHNVYVAGPELPLTDARDLPELREHAARIGALAIPHHIGYSAGYRGIDWTHYREDASPFVEMYSLHGCSLADDAPFPMLHDMGPRDAGSTAEAGWEAGRRFGIVAGTDHHGAYPGSHGDGRMGAFAEHLTRESLWDAFVNRRVFAATGDRIDARLFVDDAWIGSEIHLPETRRIRVEVTGSDAIDRAELLKNGRIIARFFADASVCESPPDRYRLRIRWGWGRKDRRIEWTGRVSLSDGAIVDVQSCFSGQPVVAPKEQRGDAQVPDDDLPHELLERTERSVAWRSQTTGNPTMKHATMQALSLGIEARPESTVEVEANGRRYRHSLAELVDGGRSHFLQGWLSEAIRIGPAVPIESCRLSAEVSDEPERDIDVYRLQVAQRNGQWAWLSPIWAMR